MSDYESDSIQNTTESEQEIIPYYKANKTSISMQKKEYYKKNREKILKKVKCDCGRYISKNQLERHKKTKVHTQYLEFLENENIQSKNKNNILNFD